MKIKLVVIGAAGRMGSRILQLAAESGEFEIHAAIEVQGHPDIGKQISLAGASGPVNIALSDTFPGTGVDVVINFSLPDAVDKTIDYCLETVSLWYPGLPA